MHDKFSRWKYLLFEIALFIIFIVALAKLIYYEIWG